MDCEASRPARAVASVRAWLPKGQLLPDHILRRRHQTIVWLLWAHVVGLTIFGLAMGQTARHMAVEGTLMAIPAVIASSEWVGLRLRGPPPRSASSRARRCSSTSGAASSRRTSTSS